MKAGDSNDLFAMNKAHFSAVYTRKHFYDDDYDDAYDYMHGQKQLTFLGTHSVKSSASVGNHAGIVIMVSPDSKYYGDRKNFFTSGFGGKVHFATIGGGPDNTGSWSGILLSHVNRPDDIDLSNKNGMQNLHVSDEEKIDKLFALNQHYMNIPNEKKAAYRFVPSLSFYDYNSNSYSHGLLKAAGIPAPQNPTGGTGIYPGWERPLPGPYFGVKE